MIHIHKKGDGRSFLQISLKPQYFLLVFLLISFSLGFSKITPLLHQAKKASLPTKVMLSPTPTPIDVEKWQTYIDYVHHFLLKYPRNLNVIPDAEYFAVTDKPNPSLGIVTGRDDMYYQISVNLEPSNGESLDEYVKRHQYDRFPEGHMSIYRINGISGYKITDIGMDSHTDLVIVKKDDYIYRIFRRRFYANMSAGEEVYEKVLSTFKFID